MDDRKNPGIKIPFLSIDKPIVEATRCVEIRIPDHDDFMPVLGGLISIATKWFNYQRDETHKGAQLAKMWSAAYIETDWEQCMNCEELTACIQPLLDAQTAQIQTLLNISKYGTDAQPGMPMTEDERAEDLAAGTNPTCDTEITCGQAKGISDYLVDTVTAVLNDAEAATNTLEFLDVIVGITGLDETSADVLTGYATFVQDALTEGYIAQADPAYKDAVTCAIWCKAKPTCEITPEMLMDVFRERLGVALGGPLPVFATLVDMFQFLYGVPMSGSIIADVMHLIVTGGGVLANVFMGEVGTKSLKLLLDLKKDEPSDDCGLLCECPVEPNITLIQNQPGDFNFTFLSNTVDGGSIWEATSVNTSGLFVVSCNIQIDAADVCCEVVSASPVTNYQHFLCGPGTVVSGSGDGASTTVFYEELGFYTATAGVTVTIEVKPVP